MSLSFSMFKKHQQMLAAGHPHVFGDREGELLYILVRETRPELVFEISPNTGYSTNYLLSALTANKRGQLFSFEIIKRFGSTPTEQVVRQNLVEECDQGRLKVFIGDARVTAVEQIKIASPDVMLIDSCHEQYFAEFYLRDLLPRVTGWVAVHDIAHFDPRSEGSTEADYLLSHLQNTASDYLLLGLYDDNIGYAKPTSGFKPRMNQRSSTILLQVGKATTPAPPRPLSADPEAIVLAAEEHAAKGRADDVRLTSEALSKTPHKGGALPLRMATACVTVDLPIEAEFWLGRAIRASSDLRLPTRYRLLLDASVVTLKLGNRKRAVELFTTGVLAFTLSGTASKRATGSLKASGAAA